MNLAKQDGVGGEGCVGGGRAGAALSPPGPVAVGLSGGVDSSVAAAVLQEAGWEVWGVTALLTREQSRCCSPEDVRLAQAVAARLGIPHQIIAVAEEFERGVIAPFAGEYLAGRTPSPCVVCNRDIKFGVLLERVLALGAAALATGHYARLERDAAGRPRLRRGADRAKDQSYFLALLGRQQLERVVLPLGTWTKGRVRELAQRLRLPSRDRGESQELCFVGDAGHGNWLDVRCLQTPGAGEVVDTSGRLLGRHAGIHHYTIGQRRGLKVAGGRRLYVVALDAARNRVVVGERAEAMSRGLRLEGVQWTGGSPPAQEFRAACQIRYRHEAAPASIRLLGGGQAEVRFDEPQFAATPGQLAALYDGDEVLGGGWIAAGV